MPERTEHRLQELGPWGLEDGVGYYVAADDAGNEIRSASDALSEFMSDFDDWQEYALSVEGPLMYHDVPGDPEGAIRPCECEDDHEGQHEVWKVVAQQQEPTARTMERRRVVRHLAEIWPDDELWAQATVIHEIRRLR